MSAHIFLRKKIHLRKSTQEISSSEQVFLKNLCWVPDSCHRKAGKSSCELFEKVRVNKLFFWTGISGFRVGLLVSNLADFGAVAQTAMLARTTPSSFRSYF